MSFTLIWAADTRHCVLDYSGASFTEGATRLNQFWFNVMCLFSG